MLMIHNLLGATVQNLVATPIWCTEFVYPWFRKPANAMGNVKK
jgi:hypothetical protein